MKQPGPIILLYIYILLHQTILAQHNICNYLTLLREMGSDKKLINRVEMAAHHKKLLEDTVNIFHDLFGAAVG